jgi:transposase
MITTMPLRTDWCSIPRQSHYLVAAALADGREDDAAGMSVSYVAWRADIAPSLLFNWRRRMLEGGLQAVQAD